MPLTRNVNDQIKLYITKYLQSSFDYRYNKINFLKLDSQSLTINLFLSNCNRWKIFDGDYCADRSLSPNIQLNITCWFYVFHTCIL
jgi:hypothetical protein